MEDEQVSNLCLECVDKWNNESNKNDYRLFWEGNYYDSDVYDYGEVTSDSLTVLVQKCANVFTKLGLQDSTILLYLPNVLQLPVASMAALRIGAKFLPFAASDESIEHLKNILTDAKIDAVITVDGFWRGTHLIKTKFTLDKAIEESKANVRRVLVVRHVSPNKGVPPPRREYVASRPYYGYTVSHNVQTNALKSKPFVTKLDTRHFVNMKEERDSWWSEHFPNANISHSPSPTDTPATMIRVSWRDGKLSLSSLPNPVIKQNIQKVAELTHPNEICFVASYSDAALETIAILGVLSSGAKIVLFEGDGCYPDYSRLLQVVEIYEVKKLLICEEDLKPLIQHPEYSQLWNTSSLEEIVILGSGHEKEPLQKLYDKQCIKHLPLLQSKDTNL
ncbi:unnamed protein product [Enterobius vermicularis]|uniref:acetate--CoA ligase n=1 Tax=Enterobius vermicularis TaxID=51028 RepID=A0A0N4V8T2_ENTVE|nr:unnamed protein product [Enterobius vermicularis]